MGQTARKLSVLLLAVITFNVSASEVTLLPFTQTFTEEALYDQKADTDYYVVESVEVQEVEENFVEEKNLGEISSSLGQVVTIVDQLIALGKKVWPIIEAGRPVVNTAMISPISVLPKSDLAPEEAFYQMSGWSMPSSKSYKVAYKNRLGSEVISFVYTVTFQHGGQFEDKGSYLTGVNVIASQVYVAWGFSFDANSALVTISNLGSRQNPIAGATLMINYKASSILTEVQTSESFFVAGDGRSQKL